MYISLNIDIYFTSFEEFNVIFIPKKLNFLYMSESVHLTSTFCLGQSSRLTGAESKADRMAK